MGWLLGDVRAVEISALARRRGQARHHIFRVLDGQYDAVVPGVGQVDDNPGVVAVAYGEGDALVLMKASHPDAGKLRACPLQAMDFGNDRGAGSTAPALAAEWFPGRAQPGTRNKTAAGWAGHPARSG